jgi:hypothetical protein
MAHRLKAALASGFVLIAAPAAFAQPVGTSAPATVEPDRDEYLQYAASVAQVHPLSHQGDASVSIFSTVGGDPAMNGEYVFLSFDISPAEGARIFKVGDVLEYRILSETPGRILLQVSENVMRDGGEIGTESRRVAVTWRPGADGAPPGSVTVATMP